MSATIRIEIVTPDRQVFNKEVDCAFLPTLEGEIGVLPGHMPLVTGLRAGTVRLTLSERDELRFSIAEGLGMIEPKIIRVFTSQASEVRG